MYIDIKSNYKEYDRAWIASVVDVMIMQDVSQCGQGWKENYSMEDMIQQRWQLMN